MMRCRWCLALDHTVQHCPSFRQAKIATEHGIVDPMHAEDPQDQLALRCHALRAALRGVLVEGRRLGIVWSTDTATLIQHADPFDP